MVLVMVVSFLVDICEVIVEVCIISRNWLVSVG